MSDTNNSDVHDKRTTDVNKNFYSFDKNDSIRTNENSWNVYEMSNGVQTFSNLGKIFQLDDKVYLNYVLYNRNIIKSHYEPEEVLIDITDDFAKCCQDYNIGTNFVLLADNDLFTVSDCLSEKLEYLSFARLFIEE